MGIFTRKKRLSPTDGLILGRTWVDRELDAAVAAVEAGGFDTALAGLKEQNGDRRGIWNAGLAEAAKGRSEQLEARLEDVGGRDPDLLVWLAQTLVLEGWEVRTGYVASMVSDQQFRTFHDILRTAREVVEAAIEVAPDDPTPWTVYQWVAIGLGADLDRHEELFQEAIARHPTSYAAHGNKVHAIAPKWYGTTIEEMLAFGAETADQAAPGSVLVGVLGKAVAEARLHVFGFTDASAMKKVAAATKLANTWTDPLIAAREKWLQPGRAPEAPDLDAHNYFAYLLKKHRDEGRASADAMFNRVGTLPWAYGGDPLEAFAEEYRR
ncbi:hypothetical protein [Kribbella italica]|uniref:DUF4034 domain-containing protein n=1 Tax=Kribbella italica TaxID=1540520 RepID=A0A7W9J6P2_9ACTN|nr:hypothetical protein [Kribbella italica]MBB5836631.1 hypothetical protein [Kribbella italica]